MRSRISLFVILSFLFLFCVVLTAQKEQQSTAPVVAPPPANATVQQLEETADTLRMHKDYEHAINYFEAAIKKDPKNSVLYNKCGIAQMQLNRPIDARGNFKKALKLAPTYAEANNNMGAAYYIERNFKKAIREYEKAIALKPTMASFYANLGTAWFARNKIELAMEKYEQAVKLDPEVLLRTSQSGVAAQVSSPEDRAHYNYVLAKLYAKHGDIDRSIECLRRAKDQGYSHMDNVLKDPEFAAVRIDPRFSGIMTEVGK